MASKDRLCDYFAVVGPRESDIEDCVAPELYSISNMPRYIDDAICDICVVMGPKENIPVGYGVLKPESEEDDTLKKHAYICFRRRNKLGANSSNSYITDIKVIRKGQEFVPEGFEMLEKTVGGASADLNKGGQYPSFLAIRRAIFTEESLMGSVPPPVLDLALCWDKKGDSAPLDFTVIPRQLNKLDTGNEEVYLAYHHGPRPGICDIPYDAATLEWFPDENTHEDFPLPSSELPMFCFPRGLYLKHAKQSDVPMPSYFSFVFTSIDGDRVHVACLQFYEMLPDRVIKELEKRQQILMNLAKGEGAESHWDHDEDSVSDDEEDDVLSEHEGDDDKKRRHAKKPSTKKEPEAPKTDEELNRYCLFAPRCLCIITHWPFYRAVRSFLQQIYRFSLSPSVVPIERYISYFVQYLPLPPPGIHAMNLHLDLGLNDSVDLSAVQPIVLHLPDARSLPLMDLDFDAPFCCLSIDNVLKVFLLMLIEERLVFISSSTSLLTETMETLLALLFPLEWRSCYIPRLPNKLHEILDAPGSFLLGIYVEGSTKDFVCPPLSDPVYIVDLDHNRITDAEGKPGVSQLMEGFTQLESLKDKLIHELFRAKLGVRGVEQLRERDSAFELPTLPGIELEGDAAPKLNTELIRDAFLCFMVETLGSYTKFFNSQDNKSGEDENQGVFMAFDVQAFVNGSDKPVKPLMERLVTTQMFATLVQQRMEHGQGIDRLVFFESCVQELKERKEAEEKKSQKGHWAEYGENTRKSVTPPRSPSGAIYDHEGKRMSSILPDLASHLGDRRTSMLLHEAVALENFRKQGIAALTMPDGESGASSPPLSTSPTPSSPVSMTVIIPGPGIEGCDPEGTSYSYARWPTLNKDWMIIPSTSLHPILLEINSKRKKYMKKGNRMILARSVSECMKDMQAIGEFINKGGSKDKELHLALQIFGIYFMCLPSRVSYQGKPIKVVMQAMGVLQFVLGFNAEKYMDEAMWRSILVACGRCGHTQTRKIAIAIFEIIRRSGVTINALTYGQYTKALSEKDAVEIPVEGRDEIDDTPWLEDKGSAWYMATCEAAPPETIARSRSVADSLRDLLSTQRIRMGSTTNAAKQNEEKKKAAVTTPEGEVWTSLLRDPVTSAYNTTLSRVKLDAGGVVGLSLFCICTNPDCQYMPLDEEIMTLRQDLLMVSADEHQGNLLLCPKCQNRLSPKLYYEAQTFKDYVKPAVVIRASSVELDTPMGTSRRMSASTQGPTAAGLGGLGARAGSRSGPNFFAGNHETPRKRGLSSSQINQPALFERTFRPEALRGEISGLGLGATNNGYVDYISPFTLRMRMERLLLEHGEDSLTREWTREHHPEIFWNLVWYCTRLSVPFPLLLDGFPDLVAMENAGLVPPNSDGSMPSSRLRGYSRRESGVDKQRDLFHEVVVVGWEDRVVRARCKVVSDLLATRGNIQKEGGIKEKPNLPLPPNAHAYPARPPIGSSFFNTSSHNLLTDTNVPKHVVDAVGSLTIAEIFPNISQKELDAMQDVGSIMTRKGVPGLKEAVAKFLYYRASFSGWTSEAALGCMYRVFVKLAAHLRIKKLPTVTPLSNIAERPIFEQEYALVINKLTERQLRDQAEKEISELMAELPSRDALKFRSVFGQLF